MSDCIEFQHLLPSFLENDLDADPRGLIQAHLQECPACVEELSLIRAVREVLPPAMDVAPPHEVRQNLQAVARAAVEPQEHGSAGRPTIVRMGFAAVLATVLAIVVIWLFTLRGAMAPLSNTTGIMLTVLFAGLVAAAAGGLLRTTPSRPARTALTGALGGLGGYALLSMVLPISHTVNYCGDLVFGNIHLSLGQLCTTYLGVTAAYAGIPMALVAFTRRKGPRTESPGLLEAMMFSGLALPILLMQSGLRIWLIPVSVALGFLGGALIGEMLGRRARLWMRGTG